MDEKLYASGEPKAGTYTWRWVAAGALQIVLGVVLWFLFHNGIVALLFVSGVLLLIFALVMYLQRDGQQPMPNQFETDFFDDKDDVEGDKLR